MMGFGAAVRTCFRKYFRISGRASRAEYWWFALFTGLLVLVASVVEVLLIGPHTLEGSGGPIVALTNLATICPSLTVLIRRMHDIGKRGYVILVPLLFAAIGIAIGAAFGPALGAGAGWIVGITVLMGVALQFYWLVKPSDHGENAFGPSPLEQSQ